MNETVVVAAALVILLGAVAFYLYSRITYVEGKVRTIESVLMDLKMTLDMMVSEEPPEGGVVMPMQGGAGAPAPVAPLEPMPVEPPAPLAEESFYSSVLEQAHSKEESGDVSGLEVLEQPDVPLSPASAAASVAAAEPNYDMMSRADLITEAERRGLRIPKRTGRGEIITLLRKTPAPLNRSDDQGAVSSQNADTESSAVVGGSGDLDLDQAEEGSSGLDAALGPAA